MIANLRETKAKLSQMVKLAAGGEEVLITVHGKQLARIVGISNRPKKLDRERWLGHLARLRKKTSTGRRAKTAQEIQDEDRGDRF